MCFTADSGASTTTTAKTDGHCSEEHFVFIYWNEIYKAVTTMIIQQIHTIDIVTNGIVLKTYITQEENEGGKQDQPYRLREKMLTNPHRDHEQQPQIRNTISLELYVKLNTVTILMPS